MSVCLRERSTPSSRPTNHSPQCVPRLLTIATAKDTGHRLAHQTRLTDLGDSNPNQRNSKKHMLDDQSLVPKLSMRGFRMQVQTTTQMRHA